MAKNTHEPSGIQRPLPLCPGNAKAGQAIRREEFGGAKPYWLDPANSAWPKERVAKFDEQRRAKAGTYEANPFPKLKPNSAHRIMDERNRKEA